MALPSFSMSHAEKRCATLKNWVGSGDEDNVSTCNDGLGQPGTARPPVFQHATLKSWEWPGDEAKAKVHNTQFVTVG